MFTFVVVVQIVGIAIIVGELMWLFRRSASRYQLILLTMLVAMLINFVGELVEITATTELQAALGIRFSYVGKPFIVFAMFMFFVEFCRARVPMPVIYAAGIEATVTSVCAFTFPYHQLFYSSYDFVTTGLFPHLVTGKGPYYLFHSAVIVAFFVFCLWCCIHLTRTSKSEQTRRQVWALLIMSTVCIAGFLLFLSGIAQGYDTTLPAYVIALLILSHVLLRGNLIDSLTMAREQAVREYRDGLIVLDQRGDVVGVNKAADRVLRDLAGVELDAQMQVAAVKSLRAHAAAAPLLLADRVYDVLERAVESDGVNYGYTYEIRDITDSHNYAARLQRDVEAKTKQIRHIQRGMTVSFANIVEARDNVTGTHIKNTSDFVAAIVTELRTRVAADSQAFPPEYQQLLDENYVETIRDAAPLHDVGKIAVPDSVLTKPGKLTAEEFAVIKKHSQAGADLIEETMRGIETDEYVEIAKRIAQSHHERWDGKGYPQGLRENQIPLSARIMAVADVYDALRSARQYKPAFSKEKSRGIIQEESGAQFDPLVVDAFMAIVDAVE